VSCGLLRAVAGSPLGQAGDSAGCREAGHAEHDGAVLADRGHCLIDIGALPGGQGVQAGSDTADFRRSS